MKTQIFTAHKCPAKRRQRFNLLCCYLSEGLRCVSLQMAAFGTCGDTRLQRVLVTMFLTVEQVLSTVTSKQSPVLT